LSRTAPGSPPSSLPRQNAAELTAQQNPGRCSVSTVPGAHPGTASQTFRHLVPALGLAIPDGVAPPVLHSLRHSFAVGCLLRWYREGTDPQARLLHLSTFTGHVDPVSTAVYLTVTAQLLDEANRRFESFAQPAWLEAAL